jgi:hypothetical protein
LHYHFILLFFFDVIHPDFKDDLSRYDWNFIDDIPSGVLKRGWKIPELAMEVQFAGKIPWLMVMVPPLFPL